MTAPSLPVATSNAATDGKPDKPPQEATGQHKVPAARPKRWRILLVAVVILLIPYHLQVVGMAAVVSVVPTEVISPTDGLVGDIGVIEGQQVKAGDPVATLVSKDPDPDGWGRQTIGRALSPIAGVVITPNHILQSHVNTWVRAGDPLCTVLDRSKLIVVVDVPQREIADTHVGQSVNVKLYGYPGTTLSGKVTRIAETGRVEQGESVVPAEVTINDAPSWLRPGLHGWAKIGGNIQVVGTLMVRRLARSLWVELWSLL